MVLEFPLYEDGVADELDLMEKTSKARRRKKAYDVAAALLNNVDDKVEVGVDELCQQLGAVIPVLEVVGEVRVAVLGGGQAACE